MYIRLASSAVPRDEIKGWDAHTSWPSLLWERMLTKNISSTLRAKKWAEFQHYKHRNPPWIRLYRKLLDDCDFHSLPVASRALAPMLWLLASESDGIISLEPKQLSFRLRGDFRDLIEALKPLIEKGFFDATGMYASAVLAPCVHHATTETDTETEVTSTPPTPPLVRGEEQFFEWQRETIGVFMGGKRRLFSERDKQGLQGARATDVVDFLKRKGFIARVVAVQ